MQALMRRPTPPSTQHTVKKLFDDMYAALGDNQKAIDFTCQMQALVEAYVLPDMPIDWREDYRLTGVEGRIAEVLYKNLGKQVHRNAIYEAVYFDYIKDSPEPKIIDVKVCHMRKKLEGSGFEIETVWGFGYRMKEKATLEQASV